MRDPTEEPEWAKELPGYEFDAQCEGETSIPDILESFERLLNSMVALGHDRKGKALHYKRDGTPCSCIEAIKIMTNWKARLVKQEVLPAGFYVSTVFLCIAHPPFTKKGPMLFETAVFNSCECRLGEVVVLENQRYRTEAQAIKGHKSIVRRWTLKEPEGNG